MPIKPTAAAKLTKQKVYVIKKDGEQTYQILGPKRSSRLCSSTSLFSTPDYQSALTLARLWRLELTLELMQYPKDDITAIITKYHEMDFGLIPQFYEMLRDSVQP